MRLGIVNGGRIAGRFMEKMRYVSGVQATAYFNPKKESAEAFANRWDVDAVYIASPHGTHFDYCRRAIEVGRHVLCEKPMALSESQARELCAAIKRGIVLLEANKTAFAPGFLQMLASYPLLPIIKLLGKNYNEPQSGVPCQRYESGVVLAPKFPTQTDHPVIFLLRPRPIHAAEPALFQIRSFIRFRLFMGFERGQRIRGPFQHLTLT